MLRGSGHPPGGRCSWPVGPPGHQGPQGRRPPGRIHCGRPGAIGCCRAHSGHWGCQRMLWRGRERNCWGRGQEENQSLFRTRSQRSWYKSCSTWKAGPFCQAGRPHTHQKSPTEHQGRSGLQCPLLAAEHTRTRPPPHRVPDKFQTN